MDPFVLGLYVWAGSLASSSRGSISIGRGRGGGWLLTRIIPCHPAIREVDV